MQDTSHRYTHPPIVYPLYLRGYYSHRSPQLSAALTLYDGTTSPHGTIVRLLRNCAPQHILTIPFASKWNGMILGVDPYDYGPTLKNGATPNGLTSCTFLAPLIIHQWYCVHVRLLCLILFVGIATSLVYINQPSEGV